MILHLHGPHSCDTFCLLTELGLSDPSGCLGAISYTPDAARMAVTSIPLKAASQPVGYSALPLRSGAVTVHSPSKRPVMDKHALYQDFPLSPCRV